MDETLRLIAEGASEVPLRLSGRVRFAPLAVDVEGQFAATVFVRRGQGSELLLDEWTSKNTDGEWSFCGGGGGTEPTEVLADRPSEAELGGTRPRR